MFDCDRKLDGGILVLKVFMNRAGEMAQQLRAQAALPEDWGAVPSPHMASYNHLSLQFQGSSAPFLASSSHAYTWHTNIHVGKALRNIKDKRTLKKVL